MAFQITKKEILPFVRDCLQSVLQYQCWPSLYRRPTRLYKYEVLHQRCFNSHTRLIKSNHPIDGNYFEKNLAEAERKSVLSNDSHETKTVKPAAILSSVLHDLSSQSFFPSDSIGNSQESLKISGNLFSKEDDDIEYVEHTDNVDAFSRQRNQNFRSSASYCSKILNDSTINPEHLFKPLVYNLNLQTFKQLIDQKYNYTENFHKRPVLGSLVEARTFDNEIRFGIVIREQIGNFKDSLSKIKIFTIEGKVEEIRATDISFHLYAVFDPKKIQLVFGNNGNQHCQQNSLLYQHLLLYLIKGSVNLVKILDARNFDDIAFSKLARHNTLNGLTVDDYIDELPIFSTKLLYFSQKESLLSKNKLNKLQIYISVHFIISSRPERYIFVLNKNNFAPLQDNQYSNSCPNAAIMANSIQNSLLVNKVLNEEKFQENISVFVKEVNDLLNNDINESNKFYKWLNNSVFLNHKEYEVYDSIINLFKYYIAYPHQLVATKLENILHQITTRPDGLLKLQSPITQRQVFKFLQYFGIYKDDTDIYLSNNFLSFKTPGQSQSVATISQLVSTSKTNEDLAFQDTYSFANDAELHNDNFSHLRYVRNKTVYGLPSNLGHGGMSEMAISFSDVDQRNLTVNIHVPDIGSFIHPKSELLYHLLLNGRRLEAPNGTLEFLPKSIINNFAFKTNAAAAENGANSNDAIENKGFNCITFSFKYDPWRDDLFDFDKLKINIKLEFLKSVKVLDEELLLDVLEDKLDFFGLFSQSETSVRDFELRKIEKEAIRSVYSICKRRNMLRNGDYALESDIDLEAPKIEVNGAGSFTQVTYDTSHRMEDSTAMFLRELKVLVNEVAARYAIQNKLPVNHHSQNLVQNGNAANDYREVVPENYMLPRFKAYDYEHFLFGKLRGRALPTSYFSALSYLDMPKVGFDPGNELEADLNNKILEATRQQKVDDSEYTSLAHRKLGIRYGYVKVNSPFSELEQLINQWQIIVSLNKKATQDSTSKKKNLTIVNNLNIKGFSESPLLAKQLGSIYHEFIHPRNIVVNELSYKIKRYWTLRWLEQEIQKEDSVFAFVFIFKCVVTQSAEHPSLAVGYCMELGTYVDIQLQANDKELIVGDQVLCSKIMHLDPISGILVLLI